MTGLDSRSLLTPIGASPSGATRLPRSVPSAVRSAPEQKTVGAISLAPLPSTSRPCATGATWAGYRAVATHLHQVFPKLGVTSRAALRDALSGSESSESSESNENRNEADR
jgi:hypothetical protein